jgi:hypothetical protein
VSLIGRAWVFAWVKAVPSKINSPHHSICQVKVSSNNHTPMTLATNGIKEVTLKVRAPPVLATNRKYSQ